MRTTDRVLTVALLAYMIQCCSGFSQENSRKFSGQLTPMDPNVCTTQNITFTSELLQSPLLNFSIGFAVKSTNTNTKYVAVDYDKVTEVNETMSQFTLDNITLDTEDISKPVYVHVKSYYWQKFGDKNDTLQLGKTTSMRIYPLLETVRDFKCIVMNYVSMNCSWNYGKDYGENMPEVIFQWRIPSLSGSWTDCKDLSTEYGYCYWKDSTAGYFKRVNITIRITLKQKCDLNNSTYFDTDTSKIVKPNPVSSISSKVIDSTCIQVFWYTSDSEPQNPKEHRIIVSSEWDNSTMTFKTSRTDERFPHNRTFCDLHPYTEYTFSVSIQPIGLYSGFFSDEKKMVSKTFSDIPVASPEVIEGGYNSNHRDCDESGQERRVCIVWKSIKDEYKNGPMKGIQGLFTAINAKAPPVQEDWAEDSTYGCSSLLCDTSYYFTIKARNVNGTSDNGSTITIPSFNPGNTPPQFIVESTNTSEVYINLDQRDGRHTKEYTVVWCRKHNGHCQSGHEVSWKHFPSNTTEAVLHINSSQDNLYGVSVVTEDGSSGVEWQDCVYLKHTPPKREPQNVVVSAGSDDNTLVVTWDKLTCKSDEPYIAMYNVQFNKLDDINRKSINVTESDEARVVLRDMQEDQTYFVTVRGITKDGRYGPESQPQTGVPVNKSLKPTQIAGISMAALVCAIFAGVGLFCIVRICKTKAKRAIEDAGNITIPEMPDFVLDNDLRRQNSNDSGYDMTPPPERSRNAIQLGSSEFVQPYDYRYASVDHGETTIGYSEMILGHCETITDHGETTFDHDKITRYQSETAIGNGKSISHKEATKDHGEPNIGYGETTNGEETIGNCENKGAVTKRDALESEPIHQNADKPERHASKSTQESKLMLIIPKPVAFTLASDSEMSFSAEENIVTTDSSKDKIIDYVKCKEASSDSINNLNPLPNAEPLSNKNIQGSVTVGDNNSQNVKHGLHLAPLSKDNSETSITAGDSYCRHLKNELHLGPLSKNNTETSTEVDGNNSQQVKHEMQLAPLNNMNSVTSVTVSDSNSQKLTHEAHKATTSISFPLDIVLPLINIPCPNEMERSNDSFADDDNEMSLTDTKSNCRQSRRVLSPSSSIKKSTLKCPKDYIPHNNCIEDNLVRENTLDSSKIDISNKTNGYVPHANTITDYIPSYAVQSYIPHDGMGNIAIHEKNMDLHSTSSSCAIHTNIDQGYVFSRQSNGVTKELKTKFPSDIGYVEQGNILPRATDDKSSVSFQGYVDNQFIAALQKETLNSENCADSEEETEHECLPVYNEGYVSHAVLK